MFWPCARREEEWGALPWWEWVGLAVRGVGCSLWTGDMWAHRGNRSNSSLHLAKQKIPDFLFSLMWLAALGINIITGTEDKTNCYYV